MATVKPVSFKDKEQDLLDFVGKRDFSYYVKELIRKDREEKLQSSVSSGIEKVPSRRRNTNFDM